MRNYLEIQPILHLLFGALIYQTATQRNQTWFEAQASCRSQNLTLQTKHLSAVGTYWTGHFKKMSGWVHLLGCYSDPYSNMSELFYMPVSSAGLCQDICSSLNKNITHFAIKESTCLCLVNFKGTNRLQPSACNFICDIVTSAYNVYASVKRQFGGFSKRCFYLQCAQNSKIYEAENCARRFLVACEEKDFLTVYTDWISAMKHCKDKHLYLFTNLTLENAFNDCKKVQSVIFSGLVSGQIWINVARHIYRDVDKGHNYGNEDHGFYKACEMCKNHTCFFIDCESQVPVSWENCGEKSKVTGPPTTTQSTRSKIITRRIETTPLKTATPLTEEIRCTTKEDLMKDNCINVDVQEKEVRESSVMISILVPAATVIVIGVVLAIILFKRKQKKSINKDRISGLKKDTPDIQNSNSRCTEPANAEKSSSYFVLEPTKPCYEMRDNNTTEAENPYNDDKEGTYDHLRDNASQKKAAADVYHHADFAHNCDSSDYDFAGRSHYQESDDTYDHTNRQTAAKYDYESDSVLCVKLECDYASM